MKLIRLVRGVLLAALVLAVGCDETEPASDPLAGWKWDGAYNPVMADSIKQTTGKTNALGEVMTTSPSDYERYAKVCPFDPAIMADYHDFIIEKDFYLENSEFFEDGFGNHAVRLTVLDSHQREYTYIFIYDKSNVRTKIIKYFNKRYQS